MFQRLCYFTQALIHLAEPKTVLLDSVTWWWIFIPCQSGMNLVLDLVNGSEPLRLYVESWGAIFFSIYRVFDKTLLLLLSHDLTSYDQNMRFGLFSFFLRVPSFSLSHSTSSFADSSMCYAVASNYPGIVFCRCCFSHNFISDFLTAIRFLIIFKACFNITRFKLARKNDGFVRYITGVIHSYVSHSLDIISSKSRDPT